MLTIAAICSNIRGEMLRLGFLTVVLLVLAGCTDVRKAPAELDSGPPVRGGILKIVGGGDVDHLETTSGYGNSGIWLARTYARELVTYPISEDFEAASRVVADLAEVVPSIENGGISPDGLTYTFHMRHGVMWNTKPPREVVAPDVVRAMRLLCNPVNPTGAPGYYESTITDMQEYCDGFAKVPGTVEDIKRYMGSGKLEGVSAPDDFTVVFHLVHPATDFFNILAMPFAAAVPVEYLNYLPDGPEFRQHTISDGPYQITKYIANHEYQLERNPAWDPKTDPVRPAYVDRIIMTLGLDQQLAQLQLEAGTADLSFDQQPPVAELASLLELGDTNLVLAPPGDYFGQMNYVVINLIGPNNDGALKKLKVRQALEYAVDKVALAQDWGGPSVALPVNQAVMRSVSGYKKGADHYETPGSHGDPEKARQLLAEAGYPNGITLKLAYQQSSLYPLDAQSLEASLKRAGINARIMPYTSADFYSRLLPTPEIAKRGEWDIALAGWIPDWFGGNNGRPVIEPIFDGRHYGPNTVDYGDYDSDTTNALIDRATAALTLDEANNAWAEAGAQIMEDAAFVPLIQLKQAWSHSPRIRNCTISAYGLNCDITSVWLKQ